MGKRIPRTRPPVLASDPTVAEFHAGAPKARTELPVVFIEADDPNTKQSLASLTRPESKACRTSFGAMLLNFRMAVANGQLTVSGRKTENGIDILVVTRADVDNAMTAIETHRATKPVSEEDAREAFRVHSATCANIRDNSHDINLAPVVAILGDETTLGSYAVAVAQAKLDGDKGDFRPAVKLVTEAARLAETILINARVAEVEGFLAKLTGNYGDAPNAMVAKATEAVGTALAVIDANPADSTPDFTALKAARKDILEARRNLLSVFGTMLRPTSKNEGRRDQRGRGDDRGRRQGFGTGNVRFERRG